MICTNCHTNEVTGKLFNGAGPADYCDRCKQHCFDIGKLVIELREQVTEKMAHVVLGALSISYSEGTTDVDSRAFDHCQDVVETELALVELLFKHHPDVVKNECYAHLPQVRKVLA